MEQNSLYQIISNADIIKSLLDQLYEFDCKMIIDPGDGLTDYQIMRILLSLYSQYKLFN